MTGTEPPDPEAYSARNNAVYSRLAGIYDFAVRHTSLYNRWLLPALRHIRGPRVLEVSFGTGWLLSRYAGRFDTYGIDLNRDMIRVTTRNLRVAGHTIPLQQARVEALPYRTECFDTVVNTMAFGGYPRADEAMSEIRRVLKPGGRLILVDMAMPADRNRMGRIWIRVYIASRDILRDMRELFHRHGFTYSDEAIGLSGSLHLYVADKIQPNASARTDSEIGRGVQQ